MRITESQLRRIVAEETRKLKRAGKLSEIRSAFTLPKAAFAALEAGIDEFVNEMAMEGVPPEEIAEELRRAVEDYIADGLTSFEDHG